MKKLLSGSDLAGFIKERHLRQVRSLHAQKIIPKLAIVQVKDDPAIDVYVSLKQKYGADVGIDVDVYKLAQTEVPEVLKKLNKDDSVHGIIIQLPLNDPSETDKIVDMVAPEKDVDALGKNAKFEPATPNAILWLLAGYNINLAGKKVLLIGKGKLVGAPLEKILKSSGIEVVVIDGPTDRLSKAAAESDIIIAAANTPEILHASMIRPATVIVDAGVAGEDLKGNVAEDVYEMEDITITPQKGGVGPLTVCALFENVIRAAHKVNHD
jgi:methylenetetrahydrofolate dehydrogenase (NADP+)/methenyltetrahydrofolate cyclohydrolase